MRIAALFGGALLSATVLVSAAAAQDTNFPERSVTLVVGVAPGASSDMLTRALARKLSDIWGHPVVVENVPGASSNIALRQVAAAEPDGYTLIATGTSLALSANLFDNLLFDPIEDFVGVTQAVSNPQILVVRPDLGVSTFDEYIELVRERNGELLFGLPGHGGIAHLINVLVDQQTDTQVRYLPYSGGAPATVDLLGGQIDAITITLAAVTEHVREGRLTPIVVSTAERSSALPDVPTLDESGLDGFDIGSWQGFLAPAGTPPEIVQALHAGFIEALNDPEVQDYLIGQGFEIVGSTPEETDALVRHEIELFGEVIAAAGITVEN